jgi:hypothetical protein
MQNVHLQRVIAIYRPNGAISPQATDKNQNVYERNVLRKNVNQ